MEVVGLILVYIDFAGRNITQRIENNFDRIADTVGDYAENLPLIVGLFLSLYPLFKLSLVVFDASTLLSLIISIVVIGFFWIISYLIITFLLYFVFSPVILLSAFLLFLNEDERPLGFLGVILATIGVLGEFYQLLTIYFDK